MVLQVAKGEELLNGAKQELQSKFMFLSTFEQTHTHLPHPLPSLIQLPLYSFS